MILRFALFWLIISRFVTCIGQNASISFQAGNKTLKLASRDFPVAIVVGTDEWPAVLRTANDLAIDFGRVTGKNGSVYFTGSRNSSNFIFTKNGTAMSALMSVNVTAWPLWTSSAAAGSGGVVMAGTLGASALIDGLIKDGKLNAGSLKGKWESFVSTVVNNPLPGVSQALVVAGSDRRGTVYGLYDISEQIGVSPWYWWADVAPKRHNTIFGLDTTKVQGPPSVKYRGFFINDEAPALTGWMNAKYPNTKVFGAEFYSRVFELLLRLRANYLWPAMWGSMFNVDDAKNQPLADEFAIVMGTSHTEPMMRATKEQTAFNPGPWQWNRNNASMHAFFVEGAKRAQPYESIFTLGARGDHDTALNGENAVQQLQSIIRTQRDILKDVFRNQTLPPQVWTLYKEVQGYYDEGGLKVPDDVTLLWADDNFGNLRRLPVDNEMKRSGGAGVYYHFDYVGSPRNYKWISTIELQRTWEQLSLAYKRNAKRIWIVNVGDIKPLEIPINHFFDLAYDMTLFEEPTSTAWWLEQFATREFGAEDSKSISQVIMTYSQLASRRKFELLDTSTYSIIDYEEANDVLSDWSVLMGKATAIFDLLPEEYRDSFFEVVLHPVLAGGIFHAVVISSAKNQLYAFQGRNSANYMAEYVLERWKEDRELKDRYHRLLGGKWNHMMDQPHFYNNYWQQPMRQLSPQLQYLQPFERSLSGDMGVTIQGSNASVPGDDQFHPNSQNFLRFHPMNPYGQRRWLDVFSQGTNNFNFTISADSFLSFTQMTETVLWNGTEGSTDRRIYVSVDWEKAPPGSGVSRINISSTTDYGIQNSAPYLLLPYNNTLLPSSVTSGFVEADGAVSMEAEHYSRQSSNTSSLIYLTIPTYGKTLSGVKLAEIDAPPLSPTTASGLEYDFYTFTSVKQANVSLILSQSLNTNPKRPLKYAIAIDGSAPKVVQYVRDRPNGIMPLEWEKAVTDATWASTTSFDIGEGRHTLHFWSLEPGVVLQKLIIDLGGVKASYLGPPESFRVGVTVVKRPLNLTLIP